jgi:hypothetical protein
LLGACITAIKGDLEELPFMKVMIMEEGRDAEINQLFESYNPDKSTEEQLNDFILDYNKFPDGSLERVLQREQIIAFLG